MKKGCLIAAIVILVILSLGLGVYFYQQSKKDPETYESEKPFVTDIVKKAVATGSVNPRQEVQIKPQVSGVVDELYVEAGQLIEKGQKIAKVRLVPSQVNINNAKNSVELARIRLRDAKRELERQKNLAGRRLDIEEAKARYENAKAEEERQRQLYEDGVISEQEYRQFKLEYEVQKSAYENAKIAAENNIKQFETEVDIRRQELQAAINNLQLLQEGASTNTSQVANLVTSTVSGMVLDVPVEEGTSVIERNNFNEGTSIAVVADMTALVFEGKVDESDVGKLKEGMPIELTIGAIEGSKINAILEYISPKGVQEEGTVKFEVRAAIKSEPDVFLRAGYSASGDIILDQREEVIALKERDIIFQGDSTFVEVKTGEQEFEEVLVNLGLSDGINIEILSGVDTTDLVKVQRN